MKIPKIAKAISEIDDELVASTENKPKILHTPLLKIGSLVAAIAIIVISITVVPTLFKSNSAKNNGVNRYVNFYTNDSAIIWPWEYLTAAEKYTELIIDDTKYIRSGSAIVKSGLKDLIGTYSVYGYDEYTEESPSKDFEVYSLKDADISQFVAVKIENEFYAFKNDTYSPPATLGELFDNVDLESAIELNRFSESGDSPDAKHFTLNNDEYIWEVIKNCKTAPFVENQEWNEMERNYLSFTISSKTLGFYKLAMYITDDGYLWTNAFSWQYLFNIGEDSAKKIIKYAKENCTEAEYEPYKKSIAGKITEITDDYFIIDDSVLCKNPKDGITYKVLLNTLYISRYIDSGEIKLGDIVQIFTDVDTNVSEQAVINDATSIDKVTIENGEIFSNE